MVNHCGDCRRCCESSVIKVFDEDIRRWKNEQRFDILLCLETIIGNNAYIMQKPEGGCIFLSDEGCEIYDTRPKICRDFPKGPIHVKQFNCRLDWRTKKKRE